MAASPVINALIRKRAEIAGHLLDLDRQRRTLADDLAAIDASLRLFDPDTNVDAIKPKRKRAENAAMRGETAKTIFAYLRQQSATTDEITAHVMARRGLDANNPAQWRQMLVRIRASLQHQRKKGRVTSEFGEGGVLVWGLRG